MNTADKIKVMQHYEDGGKIEVSIKGHHWEEWICNVPNWDWSSTQYRIKPQKTWQEELKEICRSGWVKSKVTGSCRMVVELCMSREEDCVSLGGVGPYMSIEQLKSNYEYTPKPEWME